MPRLKARYDAGQMAPLLNVGPLVVPLTKAQYDSGNNTQFPRPAKLFSHNDQQSTWQSSQPEGSTSGWGGRMGDLALTSNTNSMFTVINASGNAVFMTGETAVPYQVSSSGATVMRGVDRGRLYGSSAASTALQSLLTTSHGHFLEADYSMVNARSIEYGAFVNDALESAAIGTDFGEGNGLAAQLRVVANLIAARNRLGVTRQVFMVAMGGFDHHDGLIGSHEGLLGQVDDAMDAFYRATEEIGVANQVTTFTASDFGRTLASKMLRAGASMALRRRSRSTVMIRSGAGACSPRYRSMNIPPPLHNGSASALQSYRASRPILAISLSLISGLWVPLQPNGWAARGSALTCAHDRLDRPHHRPSVSSPPHRAC